MPRAIISDRDRIFTSSFWQSLFGLTGTKLQMSSAYHPQTDGQTERVNQCLETYLRCFVHSCPSQWLRWISLVEFWYNSSPHSTLGRSPFEVLYGFPPRHFGISSTTTSQSGDLNAWLDTRKLMHSLVKQHLLHAQARMKRQADKHRSERQFAIGDWLVAPTRSCASDSSAPTRCWLALVQQLTSWTYLIHQQFIQYFTFRS